MTKQDYIDRFDMAMELLKEQLILLIWEKQGHYPTERQRNMIHDLSVETIYQTTISNIVNKGKVTP